MDTRRAKIVCTLGPASHSEEILTRLVEAGMDVARLNFSHGSHEDHAETIRRIREISVRLRRPVAVLQDLQGPKIRIGGLEAGEAVLESGAQITLTTRPVPGTAERVSTSYEGLPEDVRPGDRLMLDDGQIELKVRAVEGTEVRCEVVVGGVLKPNKGMNLPGVQVSAPALTEKDRADLAFGVEHGVDYVALSFVRSPNDVRVVQELLIDTGIPVIAKLERAEAVDQLEEILDISEGVMVARGDLGVELPPEEVPVIQKRIIQAANQRGVFVITATQMLESMTSNPRPTRAEASDVANAVFDGADAVMLSGETAVGEYPVETVRMMGRIVMSAEASLLAQPAIRRRSDGRGAVSFTEAIGQAAAAVAEDVEAKAIVAFTQSGFTARLIAKRRPRKPIVAFTPSEQVLRQLCLCWGTQPRLMELVEETDRMVTAVEARLLEEGNLKAGDTLVILSGAPITAQGATNLLKLHRVGE